MMGVQAGADLESPNAVRIGYVYKEEEYISDILPDGTNPEESISQLIQTIRIPVSRVRAYVGTTL